MREKLPNRRMTITETLTFHPGCADEMVFDVSYGFEPGAPVKEFFSKAYKIGASLHGLMHQGCIGFSISLQCGQGMADVARVIGEDNSAEEPQSAFGLAVRAGVELDAHLTAQWAIMKASAPVSAVAVPNDHSLEINDGIGIEDLAPEDGGILNAMEETQRDVESARSNVMQIPEFLRRVPIVERHQ